VEKLCSQIAVIDHGRVVAHGTLDELRARAGGEHSLEELFVDLVGGTQRVDRPLSWLE
jgi:ABC-2 type transport system ATP-binding protein